MNCLWLETCLGSFYAAVSIGAGENITSVQSEFDSNPRNANKRISTSVNHLLNSSDLSSESIDQVYLSKGPGSFTGIKLAAAFALGFSYSHPRRVPVMGFDALSCLSKMLSTNIVLKSTSKTGFYSDGVTTKNILGSQVTSLGEVQFWNEWVGHSDQSHAQITPQETKKSTYDQLVHFVHKHTALSENFQKANYLKEPEIHSKGTQ